MRRLNVLTLLYCAVISVCILTTSSGIRADVLDDPVVRGAWLYQGKCIGCHRDYEKARLAEDYEEEKALASAIGSDRCQIAWSRRMGGELSNRDIRAIVSYFRKWEELEEEPDLPELPPQEIPETADTKTAPPDKDEAQPGTIKQPSPDKLSSPLEKVVKQFDVAAGGWLYTSNCYRCHLTYDKARMGKGLAKETIFRFVSEGKTSTQMTPFSRMLGGELKNSEIKAIVTYITTWENYGESPAIAEELLTPPAQDPADFIPLRLVRFKPVSGDIEAGKKLYRINCLACHGLHGEGYIGASLLGTKWCLRKDLFVKSIVKEGVPNSLMRSWNRSKGGTFSAKDIDDVVSYVVATMAEESPQLKNRTGTE